MGKITAVNKQAELYLKKIKYIIRKSIGNIPVKFLFGILTNYSKILVNTFLEPHISLERCLLKMNKNDTGTTSKGMAL